jgi:hypothetical protein
MEKVFIVIDCESSPNDAVWSVNSTLKKAKQSEHELNKSRVGGAITKIIEEKVD